MRFSAVLFDFDGVLVDTEWAIYQAWRRLFEAHGHPLPLAIYTRCIGSDFATWSPKAHLEDLAGTGFDWHDLDARRQHEITAELADAGPMPGACALLERLATIGTPCAVVSSKHSSLPTLIRSAKYTFSPAIAKGKRECMPEPSYCIRAQEFHDRLGAFA